MGVEIAGAKILAPGFGTSTFVWGSIIGLFMGSLAAGYYFGGMLADKKPEFAVLSTIVILAGVLTLLIPRYGPQLSNSIAQMNLGPMIGPLLAAAALFFLPSFLMGMVSPYAVKLNASSLTGLGGVTGKLYALSTFGSIVGTLLTTFLLIPHIFVSGVMQGLGLTLIVTAIFSLFLYKTAFSSLNQNERTGLGIMSLVALACLELWVIFPVEPHVNREERLLHYEDSSYHEILVTESVIQELPKENINVLLPVKLWKSDASSPGWMTEVKRSLKFNDNTESAIYPYRSQYLNAVSYTDLLHLPVLWLSDPPPRKILVVGGGGGIIPTQYHNWYGTQVDVAEIDPAVERVAKKYFQIPQTSDIRFHIGDGRQTIKNMPPGSDYDVIVLDAYSSGSQIPFHLLTWEFMHEIKSKLSPRGILVTNIISALGNVANPSISPAALFLAEYKTLKATRSDVLRSHSDNPEDNIPLFKQLYVFPKISWVDSSPLSGPSLERSRNVVIVATQEEQPRNLEQLIERGKALTTGEKPLIKIPGLPALIDDLYLMGPKPDELKNVPVMCDDYAPVDTMYRAIKFEENSRLLY